MEETSERKNISVNLPPTPTKRFSRNSLLVGVAVCLIILLTVLPIANIIYILITTGANNLSNDYAVYMPVIDKILSGTYDWSRLFRDSFNVSHFQLLPILLHLLNAKLTGWNVYYELFFLTFISIIRVFLTYQALTILYSRRIRYLLLPIIALLVFSTSQISSFEFGASGVQIGLTAFGMTLGIWGLVKFNKPGLALTIMIVGGMIASWAGAPGIMLWPAFLLGMILLGYKKPMHYLIWLFASLLVNFPYLYFLLLNRKQGVNARLHSFFDPRLVVNILGRPFANGIGKTVGYLHLGEAAGWIGLFLGIVGLALVLINRKRLLKAASPAVMFMASGLFIAWQTSVFRFMIAPWYTTMSMSYWIGLAGLAYLMAASISWTDEKDKFSLFWKKLIPLVYSLSVLVIMVGFYLKTNLTYRDKSFYLASRSPVSAACLRNYEWAPTYCERYVFQWTVNRVFLEDFAWPLQRHHLNVFAPHQQWTMQGDTILGNVYAPETPNTLGVQWYDGLPGTPAPFSDYRHLNLRVTPFQSATWKVRLPDNLLKAEFSSAMGVGDNSLEGGSEEPLIFEVFLDQPGEMEKLVFSQEMDIPQKGWSKFKLDLHPYQAQEIALRFVVRGGDGSLATLYRFPTINLTTQSEIPLTERPDVRPINTGLSPDSPKLTSSDYLGNLEVAEVHGLEPIEGIANTWHVQSDPYFYFTMDNPINLQNYGWLSFNIAASPDIPSRAAEIFLYFEGRDKPIVLQIPLMKDGGSYTYSYPLRMLDIPAELVALRLNPVMLPSTRGENIVSVDDLRFVHLP